MPARILDGEKIAAAIKAEVAEKVQQLVAAGVRPGLSAVLTADNTAGAIYIRGKVRACEALGIRSETHTPEASVTTDELLALVRQLNAREDVDGILVQLPLPPQVDTRRVLAEVDPAKDVDGFHPLNVGLLSTRRAALVPCTPAGILEILKRSGIAIAGAEAVMVGRSNIVGKPAAMLLTNHDATVTLCHSKTRDLAAVCRRADILVVAVGKPGLITAAHVKPGATVVDVGINRITERAEFEKFFKGDARREKTFAEKGAVVMGDVHPEVVNIAGAITPVPGGVGPLTIAMLMVNTVQACRMRRGGK
ncbi:MAG: bifunctional 5,10-methylenetetrahydrofolate dehydrogenase/5,10-methenyltetrahydrofolate cyclohydrolase [Terriglobales bacterium]